MKKSFKILILVLVICVLVSSVLVVVSLNGGDKSTTTTAPETTWVDYAGQVKLDMDSPRAKQEVTVHQFIDGDTTHFNVPTSVMPEGVLKARYIAINTPESTGRIEAWGKAASKFTREKLEKATSIMIESDTNSWNADSTGGRYLVWVWYKTADMTDYRNLNLEILQNGLAIASNSAQNRYGETCMKAIDQAKAEKLHVYSTAKDPDFHYGAAQEMTLKELRTNLESYNTKKVAFEGVIAAVYGGSFYVEEFDEETSTYQGMPVYYETAGLPGVAMENIAVGNRVRVVGSVTYFEPGDVWQVSGLSYSLMKPDDPANFKLISKDNTPAYPLTSPVDFKTKKVEITVNDGENETLKTVDYASMILATSISMKDLKVTSVYTSDKGNTTLDCESNGVEINIFLGELAAPDVKGKTIDVKGLVDKFSGEYQIRVLTIEDIVIH